MTRQRPHRRPWTAAILVLALSALTFGAAQTVAFWHYWGAGGERDAVDALIAAAEEATGLEVEDRFISGAATEMRRQLSTAFMAGRPPGVYQSSLGYDLKVFVDAGRLRPLDDVWARVGGEEIFPEGLRRVVSIDGHPYAIPLNMHVTNHVFYNVKVFDELGLTPPTTWEEFHEVSAILRENGVEPLANAGGSWSLYHIYISMAEVLGAEGYFAASRGEIPFDGPEFRAVFEHYRDNYVVNYMADWSGYDWVGAADRMIDGDVAMYQIGDWLVGLLLGRGLEPLVDFDFFPAPGTENLTFIQVDVIAAPTGPPDQPAVDDFLAAAAGAEAQAAFNRYKGSVAANLEVPVEIYGPVMRRVYDRVQAVTADGEVLPNFRFMLPARLGSEILSQTVLFALSPDDETLDSVLATLEGIRLELLLEDAFVRW